MMYAINLKTRAITRHENYEFTSIVLHGNKLLGIKADGIYELRDSDTDNGADIDSKIITGKMDMKSSQLKRVVDAYVGLTADADCYIKLVTDINTEEEYSESYVVPQIGNRKANCSRGHKGRYWIVEFGNQSGCYFELDDIVLNVQVLKRKVHGV